MTHVQENEEAGASLLARRRVSPLAPSECAECRSLDILYFLCYFVFSDCVNWSRRRATTYTTHRDKQTGDSPPGCR